MQLLLRGAAADQAAEATLRVLDRHEAIPFPGGPDRWRRYAIQVGRDGGVDLIVDGRLYWRSTGRLPLDRRTAFRVALGYQSFGTEVMHGPLHIYSSPKYFLSAPESSRPSADR